MKEHVKKTFAFAKKTALEKSFRRYIFVGVSTVIIDYGLLFLLRSHFKGGLFSAVTFAYWGSIIYNFLINKYWTFEDRQTMTSKQLAKYAGLLIFNYLVTIGIISGLKAAGMNEYLAKLFALAITISWTYFIYKKLIFNTDNVAPVA